MSTSIIFMYSVLSLLYTVTENICGVSYTIKHHHSDLFVALTSDFFVKKLGYGAGVCVTYILK